MANPTTNEDYQIAAYADGIPGLATLASLGLTNPHPIFLTGTSEVKLGDNSARILGLPRVTWAWGFVQQSQRDILRQYCPGASAKVWIVTPTTEKIDDVPNASQCYLAQMIWPAPVTPENPQTGRRLEYNVLFRQMVVQAWP